MVPLNNVFYIPVGEQSTTDTTSQPPMPRGGGKVPLIAAAYHAIADIHTLLHPKRPVGHRHKMHNLQPFVAQCLQEMSVFLQVYAHGMQEWMRSSLTAANFLGQGGYLAKRLHRWSLTFICD